MAAESSLIPCSVQDFLDHDPEIRGQKFFCMSTISPEDVLLRKDAFMFSRYLSHFAGDMTTLFENLGTKFQQDAAVQETLQAVKERHAYVFNARELSVELDFFKNKHADELEKDFHVAEGFQTTIRGIKIRGVYDSIQEARTRAELLAKKDKSFNVFIGQVGCWCPWSPCADHIADQEYAETQLNTLMKKYKETETLRDEMYRMRKEQLMEHNSNGDEGSGSSSSESASCP